MLSHKIDAIICTETELTNEQRHLLVRALVSFSGTKYRVANRYFANGQKGAANHAIRTAEQVDELEKLLRSAFRVRVTA